MVEIEDIDGPRIDALKFGDSMKEIRQLVHSFNASIDMSEKRNIAMIFRDLFPTCRFCGDIIVNKNFILTMTKKDTVYLASPGPRFRKVNGKLYEISCCEKCLFEHFRDDPPKSTKYYFMKANRFGAYSYGWDEETHKKICQQTVAVTLDSLIRKWGEDEGKIKWQQYKDLQAQSNSFEYKQQKYGWTKERFDEFNKNRAVTKKLMIQRYGKIEGLQKWQHYLEKQRFTNSREYFIEKWGEQEGNERFERFCKARANVQIQTSVSMESQEFFNAIYDELKKRGVNNKIWYHSINKEYPIQTENGIRRVDYYDETIGLVIEYNGDYWHANPRKYNWDSTFTRGGMPLNAKEIWISDELKKQQTISILNIQDYEVVWEMDYKRSKTKMINKILKKFYGIEISNRGN